MKYQTPLLSGLALFFALNLVGCASVAPNPTSNISATDDGNAISITPAEQSTFDSSYADTEDYSSRMPAHYDTHGKKVILVDPSVHAWGAYGPDGNLIRAGLAACGANWCHDTGRPCRTSVGTFHITSMGDENCKSSKYPKPKGGGPMPFCMFFHGDMALHGSPIMADENMSHGCIRIPVSDAEWIRYNFAQVGTTIIVRPY